MLNRAIPPRARARGKQSFDECLFDFLRPLCRGGGEESSGLFVTLLSVEGEDAILGEGGRHCWYDA